MPGRRRGRPPRNEPPSVVWEAEPIRDPEHITCAELADTIRVTMNEASARAGFITNQLNVLESERQALHRIVAGCERSLGLDQPPGAVASPRYT